MKNVFIYHLVGGISRVLATIIPVEKKLYVFHSSPDYADNSYAVYKYLILKEQRKDLTYCWLTSDRKSLEFIQKDDIVRNCSDYNIQAFYLKSLKGIYKTFRARYIFYTVGLLHYIDYKLPDKRINMWHGMPIKSIGYETKSGDITISTSIFFKSMMSVALHVPEPNVWIIGQPRNDLLFDNLNDDTISLAQYDNVGIWMPTFRRSKTLNHKDGIFVENAISFVDIKELGRINKLLNKQNSLLIIKFHPYDIWQTKKIKDYSNVKFLYNDNFQQKDLYPLLGKCDYLISDYSSVIIDYEILHRPIGVTVYDIDEYKKSRGLFVENIPGRRLFSTEELIDFIENCIRGDEKLPEYKDLFNKFRDNNASKRLILKLEDMK